MTYPASSEQISLFKEVFRLHPAGVAIVSGKSAEGLVGLTISSVASVSADPPVLSFSVTRATGSAGGILTAGTFVINLLADDQSETAKNFAITGADRFTPEQEWETFATGEPFLENAPAVLRCSIRETVQVGPSVVVLANVLETKIGPAKNPLLFRDRTFLSGARLEEIRPDSATKNE